MEDERILLEKKLNGSIYSKEDIKEMNIEELKNVVKQFESFKNRLNETSKYFESFSKEIIIEKLKSLNLKFIEITCHTSTLFIAVYDNNIISHGNSFFGNIDYYFNNTILIENVTREEVRYIDGKREIKEDVIKKFMDL